MINKAVLVGHVGKDPEFATLRTGARVARFSIATSERWKDKATGERKERTEWHTVCIFNEALVGVVEKFVGKGSKLYVEGKIRTRKYTDQAGTERWTTEIHLSDFGAQLQLLDKSEGTGRPPMPEDDVRGGGGSQGGGGAQGSRLDDLDDEIPF